MDAPSSEPSGWRSLVGLSLLSGCRPLLPAFSPTELSAIELTLANDVSGFLRADSAGGDFGLDVGSPSPFSQSLSAVKFSDVFVGTTESTVSSWSISSTSRDWDVLRNSVSESSGSVTEGSRRKLESERSISPERPRRVSLVLETWSLESRERDSPPLPWRRSRAWLSRCFLKDLRYLNCIPQTSQVKSLSAGSLARWFCSRCLT